MSDILRVLERLGRCCVKLNYGTVLTTLSLLLYTTPETIGECVHAFGATIPGIVWMNKG